MQSTFHSNSSIILYIGWQFGIVQCFWDFFAIDFETFRKLSMWTNRNNICSAWWISSALRGPFCLVLNLMQYAVKFPFRLKPLYCYQPNSWSSSVSVATVLVTWSASASFTWQHGFGHISSSVWSHAGPFNHSECLRSSMDIPLGQYLQRFRCLWHVSINPWKSFPVFLLPCWQQTLAVSCELTVITVKL